MEAESSVGRVLCCYAFRLGYPFYTIAVLCDFLQHNQLVTVFLVSLQCDDFITLFCVSVQCDDLTAVFSFFFYRVTTSTHFAV